MLPWRRCLLYSPVAPYICTRYSSALLWPARFAPCCTVAVPCCAWQPVVASARQARPPEALQGTGGALRGSFYNSTRLHQFHHASTLGLTLHSAARMKQATLSKLFGAKPPKQAAKQTTLSKHVGAKPPTKAPAAKADAAPADPAARDSASPPVLAETVNNSEKKKRPREAGPSLGAAPGRCLAKRLRSRPDSEGGRARWQGLPSSPAFRQPCCDCQYVTAVRPAWPAQPLPAELSEAALWRSGRSSRRGRRCSGG